MIRSQLSESFYFIEFWTGVSRLIEMVFGIPSHRWLLCPILHPWYDRRLASLTSTFYMAVAFDAHERLLLGMTCSHIRAVLVEILAYVLL